ncbi:MAG TPA: alpha-ketoacid dehydrogenase subunit beta, partial [Candidatus Eremiobacteraceae bacterium]|nr:alpha-ketoacid dehydrogenase subunit beta [Candidatus Eremiobacteraceae bacterium]
MPIKNVLDAIRDAMFEEMQRDPSVLIMGEDVGRNGGVFRATEGLWKEFGDSRVIDTPLAELGIVGIAIGAAMNGMRPIAEIQFADFMAPAFDQIVNEAARIRYRSAGDWTCPLVIRAPYGGGIHGALYHSQCVEAFYAHVPGLKVLCPSTPYDAKGLLKAAIRDEDPVIYLEHKKTYRLIKGEVPEGDYSVPIGRADIKREGGDLSLFTYGMMVHHALEAAERVSQDGIEVEVVDLRSLRPLDKEAVLSSARKTGKALVVYEDNLFGGYGAEIAALIAEEAFEFLDGPVMRLGSPEAPA